MIKQSDKTKLISQYSSVHNEFENQIVQTWEFQRIDFGNDILAMALGKSSDKTFNVRERERERERGQITGEKERENISEWTDIELYD